MTDQLVNFVTATFARVVKFDEECNYIYEVDGALEDLPYYGGNGSGVIKNSEVKSGICTEDMLCTAPTQSLLQRWLRENHNIMLSIYNNASGFLWNMADTAGGTDRGWSEYSGPNDSGVWDTYEEALEAGLYEAMKRIK